MKPLQSPKLSYISVRDLLSLTRVHVRELLEVPLAKPWHLLISSSDLQPFLPYSLPYRSLLSCDLCSACLLPTVHLGNMPYN